MSPSAPEIHPICPRKARQRAPLSSAASGAHTTAKKLALVIPTLREAANLSRPAADVRSVLDPLEIDYEIIVVDDDSRDGTRGDCLRQSGHRGCARAPSGS